MTRETVQVGMRFNRFTVIAPLPRRSSHKMWLCKCDCGRTKEVYECNLTSGKSKSCGCLVKEVNTKHGEYKSRIYSVWSKMLTRCVPHTVGSKNYGDRGIRVCDEWRNSYEAFRDWAYANGYDENAPKCECTLDRIDVNGDYEPSNCRWADPITQSRNRRNNHMLTFRGETRCMEEWGEILGINPKTIYYRLHSGWSAEEALGIPTMQGKKRKRGELNHDS